LEQLSLTNGKWPGHTGQFLPVFTGLKHFWNRPDRFQLCHAVLAFFISILTAEIEFLAVRLPLQVK
jgi:hypothetical protein